jgi:hypothetical protein
VAVDETQVVGVIFKELLHHGSNLSAIWSLKIGIFDDGYPCTSGPFYPILFGYSRED